MYWFYVWLASSTVFSTLFVFVLARRARQREADEAYWADQESRAAPGGQQPH